MAISRQLYELQEIDNDIEHTSQTLELKNRKVGDRTVPDEAMSRLTAAQKNLDETRHQRRDAEAEVTDVTAKITEANKQLYGGRITNPKELSSLQQDINMLTNQKDQLETKALEVIDRMEEAEKEVVALTADHQKLEADWKNEQQRLVKDIEILNNALAVLQENRRELVTRIEPQAISLYERIRKQKKPAVAKVEQGICRACRILLSVAVLQKARGGQPAQCGTCGRILFIS